MEFKNPFFGKIVKILHHAVGPFVLVPVSSSTCISLAGVLFIFVGGQLQARASSEIQDEIAMAPPDSFSKPQAESQVPFLVESHMLAGDRPALSTVEADMPGPEKAGTMTEGAAPPPLSANASEIARASLSDRSPVPSLETIFDDFLPVANSKDLKDEPLLAAPLLSEFMADMDPVPTMPSTVAGVPPRSPQSDPSTPQQNSPSPADFPGDPELGIIQVSDTRRDPELGVIQLRNPLQDDELGILELRQISPPTRPRPFFFVSTYVTASSSDNVFLVQDPVQGRFGDNFIRPGISLTAFPSVGPDTNLLFSAATNLLRYEEQSNSSYDEIRFRVGVRHRFSNRAYGQLSLSHQLLFDEGYQDQFFTNSGIELTLGRRDRLTSKLTLDSFYQGQIFFSDPKEFSNILNSVGAYLGYRISPQWDTGVGYRFTLSEFTQQSRSEAYQRITGQLRYSITPSVRVSLFGGLSYGRSSESRITFDDTFFGISFDATLSIF